MLRCYLGMILLKANRGCGIKKMMDQSQEIFRHKEGYRIFSSDRSTVHPTSVISGAGQSNYYVQADVRIKVHRPNLEQLHCCRYYIDSNHYYEFSVDPSSRFWSLQKIDKSGFPFFLEERFLRNEVLTNLVYMRVMAIYGLS